MEKKVCSIVHRIFRFSYNSLVVVDFAHSLDLRQLVNLCKKERQGGAWPEVWNKKKRIWKYWYQPQWHRVLIGMISKQNEFILTESAFKGSFKMYKKKKIYFVFLFLSAVLKKQQPSVALVKFLDCRLERRIRFNHPSWVFLVTKPHQLELNLIPALLCLTDPNGLVSVLLMGFVLVCVHKCDNWQDFFFLFFPRGCARVYVCLTFFVNCFRVSRCFCRGCLFTKMAPIFLNSRRSAALNA